MGQVHIYLTKCYCKGWLPNILLLFVILSVFPEPLSWLIECHIEPLTNEV